MRNLKIYCYFTARSFGSGLRLRCASSFTKKEAHHDCNRTAGNPEECAPLKVHRQVWSVPGAPADTMCVNRTQKSGNRENEEIDPAGRATLDIVRIDFLDDAVGNHRGAGCHPKDEHPQLR